MSISSLICLLLSSFCLEHCWDADALLSGELCALFSKKVAILCCRWRRYEGDLDLAVRATCSLASEKVKLDPSLSVKENWQSLAVSVEQNAKHSLIRDLVSTLSLSCQLRTTITQQLATALSPFERLSLVFNQFSCHCYRCYTLLHHFRKKLLHHFRKKLQVNDIMSPSALIHFIGIVVWSHCTTDWPGR